MFGLSIHDLCETIKAKLTLVSGEVRLKLDSIYTPLLTGGSMNIHFFLSKSLTDRHNLFFYCTICFFIAYNFKIYFQKCMGSIIMQTDILFVVCVICSISSYASFMLTDRHI